MAIRRPRVRPPTSFRASLPSPRSAVFCRDHFRHCIKEGVNYSMPLPIEKEGERAEQRDNDRGAAIMLRRAECGWGTVRNDFHRVGCLLILRYLMSFLADGGGCREEVLQEGAATHTPTFRLDLQLPCLDILECMDGPICI